MRKSKLLEKGQKFGRLTVVKLDHIEQKKRADNNGIKNIEYYRCLCECGNETVVSKSNLKRGHTCSCGCLHDEATKEKFLGSNKTHGMSKTRLFAIWRTMKTRCNCETNKNYKNYGGRGITVCDEWQDNFMNFYKWSVTNGYDENVPKNSITLDRINNNKGYSPNNCRWTNFKVQANNNRHNHPIIYKDITKNIGEWADENDLTQHIILNRLKKGWDIEKVLTTPKKNNPRRLITYKGVTHTLAKWAKKTGINSNTLSMRLNFYKWSIEKALTTPVRKRGK